MGNNLTAWSFACLIVASEATLDPGLGQVERLLFPSQILLTCLWPSPSSVTQLVDVHLYVRSCTWSVSPEATDTDSHRMLVAMAIP